MKTIMKTIMKIIMKIIMKMNLKNEYQVRDTRIAPMLLLLIITALSSLHARGEQEGYQALTVYNAASTTELVDDLIQSYTSKTGAVIHTSPGSSGILAKQLEQGAGGDIFISASSHWVNYLVEKDLISESKILFWNSLVLIAPEDSSLAFIEINDELDLPSLFKGRLSMGDPAHVPAGEYGRQALESYHWESLLPDRILPAANVRSALAVVEMGETELGIVYATDVLKSQKVKVVGIFPASSHKPIGYYSALVNEASPGAFEFYQFLSSPEAEKLYQRYGFGLAIDGVTGE